MDSHETAALPSPSASQPNFLNGGTVLILAIICGLSVGNMYFNQLLLADMGRTFNIPAERIGFIPASTQVGYAFLVP